MTEQMWLPQLQSELDGSRLVIKIANWNRVYITDQILHNWYITGQGLSQVKAEATNFAGAGPKGETGLQGPQGVAGSTGAPGAQGAKGDTGTQGPKGDTGATGSAGSANNVQFTGSFTIGQLLTLGSFTKDIAVQGILTTDKLNVMAMVDLPGAVDLIGARPIAANIVRLRLRGVSLLTDNTSYSVAITALR